MVVVVSMRPGGAFPSGVTQWCLGIRVAESRCVCVGVFSACLHGCVVCEGVPESADPPQLTSAAAAGVTG